MFRDSREIVDDTNVNIQQASGVDMFFLLCHAAAYKTHRPPEEGKKILFPSEKYRLCNRLLTVL